MQLPGSQDLMKSINFELLRTDWPELASLAGFAEVYAHPDPVTAIGKLRSFCEHAALGIRHRVRLPKLVRPGLLDLLDDASFKAAVPPVVIDKMHALRVAGNRAVHGGEGDTATALRMLKESHDLAKWLQVTFAGAAVSDCGIFVEPPIGGVEGSERRREKRAILERVAAQEAQMQALLEELEQSRARAEQAASTAAELQASLASGQAAADSLKANDPLAFDEAETRRYLIDVMLAEAGWNVGPNLTSTQEVGKEIEVADQPTNSGVGYVDYVLYDDFEKPLAVIEAKKTARNVNDGRTQAELYADGLENQYGQRPFIFYTNGYNLWFWNDGEGEPPRQVFGYHSKDSLQHMLFQRQERKPLAEVGPDQEKKIISRLYQFEAVQRVVEQFAEKRRKALIVQATGTGKTRVSIALCDALIRANWAKRILFLCDRRELRKQANNAFKEFLPSEPRTFVTAQTFKDRDKRIYLGTYPALMKCYSSFDVGFFDLIIADESHRSLYHRYSTLFKHFDAYQVGLTATPVDYVSRSTFDMFQCSPGNPTASYDYDEAVAQGYLVPFVVDEHTTPFLRDGIKYSQMTEEQRRQLEEQEELPQSVEFEQAQVDKTIFNKDTNRHILRNLMQHGIRVADGSRLGKTIIFARNHDHAVLLQNVFDELYPQYGGKFCRVIDNYDPRAEDLIDDFKDPTHPLTVAVSVDMLDTGIDVPEIVNLVFAKPVYSFVKFWQMIGRGTRLCLNLFGPGKDKTEFQIFDHWANFERFDQGYQSAEPNRPKALMQRVFESRLKLAETAIDKQDADAFDLALDLIAKDLASLPEKTIAVREKWLTVQSVKRDETLRQFEAATRATLSTEIAPLMEWVDIAGHDAAYQFDQLTTMLQVELLRGSGRFDDLKDELLDRVSRLPIHLSQVRVKLPTIERVNSAEFWDHITVHDLETVRTELRGVMQYQRIERGGRVGPKVVDIAEDESLVERQRRTTRVAAVEMVAYRNRVQRVLLDIFDDSPILQKIKAGEPVSAEDLETLCSLVLTQAPDLDLHDLVDYYPDTAGHLDRAIRSVIGRDAGAVRKRFEKFVAAHPGLQSHQIQFLDLLQNHIAKYGAIEIERLYEPPFTLIDAEGIDGIFDELLAGELIDLLGSFEGPIQTDGTRQEDPTP